MRLDRYLARLGVGRPAVLDARSLADLHEAHVLAVPFENLSIGWGEPIDLEVEPLFRKVVLGGRGGLCYELNTLFAWGLRELGGEVDLLSARVHRDDGTFGPEFDHMALRVSLDGADWLADVGFGDSFRRPLLLAPGSTRVEGRQTYALRAAGEGLELVRQEADGPWVPQYRVGLQARRVDEFLGMLDFHQHSPESAFTRRRVCTRATREGRVTLGEGKLVTTTLDGGRVEEPVPDEAVFAGALLTHFGIRRP